MDDSLGQDINFAMIAPCLKAIKGLSKQNPPPAKAALDQFEEQWRSGVTREFLNARYDFKKVGTDARCKSEGNVYQIHILGRRYRALLTFLKGQQKAVWLDVFVKNPTDQDRHIRTACERALRLQERNTDER